jgi:probable rRNA maturation factor
LDSEPLPLQVKHLGILFVNDLTIHRMNSEYRGKDKPTDVLSFSQLEGEASEFAVSLGDIVISLDTAERQAKKFGVSLSREVLRLLVHGILHLCGYDHENVSLSTARRMRRKEAKLMKLFSPALRFVSRGGAK